MLSRSHEQLPEPPLPASPPPLSSTGRIPPITTTPHLRPAPDIADQKPNPSPAPAPAARPVPLSSIPPDQHALLSRPDMYPPHSMSNAPHQQQQQNQYTYPHHQLAQPSYPQQQQQQQQPVPNQMQRILPPGAAGGPSGMLPPAHALSQPMSSYAAPSLPGPLPLPYDTPQQQATPATTATAATPSTSSYAEPSVYAGTKGSYKYELRVEQQPQRARMCGFGDKDRRPITPPPCVRLVIRRADTNEEVKYDEIDGSFFVLQVDLWDADALREVNVIRASSSAPTQSISTAVPMSYPPPPDRVVPAYLADMGWSSGGSTGFALPAGYMYPQYIPPSNPNIMYTRNLIGSLTVNASSLKDLDGSFGYWFVLSDLSVRTEGWFRLRMSFIDVGHPDGESGLNRSRSPVLASTFSDKFQVYSAKKFPGVIESTALSKCFAQQGIKIPIRKDGKGDKGDDDD